MAWIDTHAHLDAPELAHDVDAVREQARAQGVVHCVLPAVERSNWDSVRLLAHRHGDSYALGIHPCTPAARRTKTWSCWPTLQQHRADPRLVAVGEIGLDYFVPGLDAERQQRFYREQLVLARRFDLPVILHVRRSADQLLKVLRQVKVRGGIAHAFNGSLQQAQAFVALGFKLGFGGAVTYDRAPATAPPGHRAAAGQPGDGNRFARHSPHWLYTTAAERAQGQPQGRNTPAELPCIAQVVAGLRGMAVATWPRPAPPMPAPCIAGVQKLLHQNGL